MNQTRILQFTQILYNAKLLLMSQKIRFWWDGLSVGASRPHVIPLGHCKLLKSSDKNEQKTENVKELSALRETAQTNAQSFHL